MKPFYQDNHVTQYCVDFRENELPDECVQMVVTSPPYWGLRKYSGGQDLIWGGDKDCEHEWGSKIPMRRHKAGETNPGKEYCTKDTGKWADNAGNFCSLCGAWRGSFGLEPTPEMYVQHTIEILREIRRGLRKDGVVFWNIGDSYATHASGGKGYAHNFRPPDVAIREGIDQPKPTAKSMGLKEKDLCLIPFRVAIAAQEDGWWVRSVIIWAKPNPMPESVTDRPTESHEYILMLTKSARYYWDQEAVRMPIAESTIGRGAVDFGGAKGRDYQPTSDDPQYRGGNEQWGRTYHYNGGGRNLRSVWAFPTQPYPEAHFAVFPERLPELCVKAATPEVGCCSKCGAPWTRVLSKGFTKHEGETESQYAKGTTANRLALLRQSAREEGGEYVYQCETIGWQPTCKCKADKVPSIVLDPFSGAGTTLWVAKKLNRKSVGYEISEEYCKLALERNRQQVMV